MSDEQTVPDNTDPAQIPASGVEEGIQQIPAMVHVQQAPAVAEARDTLLAVIGAEAQHVADKYAGQASAALEQLARAYALVITGTTAGVAVASETPGQQGVAQARVSSFRQWVDQQ